MGIRSLVIVSDTVPPAKNGVARLTAQTLPEFVAQCETTLCAPIECAVPVGARFVHVPPLPLDHDDLDSTLTRLNEGGTAYLLRTMERLLAPIAGAEAVIVHTLGPLGICALQAARILGRKSMIILHNNLPEMLEGVDLSGVTTAGGEALERWAISQATHAIAPPGRDVDGAILLPLRPPRYVGERASRSDTSQRVVYHGRISREKSVESIVEAIAVVASRGLRPTLLLLGDGPRVDAVRELALRRGVTLEHHQWLENPLQLASAADLYVTASRMETYSFSTLEALGCGLPVISRAVGAIPTYVRHNENGLLFHEDNELVGLLETALRDSNLRNRLGREALAQADSRSLWRQFASGVWEILSGADTVAT